MDEDGRRIRRFLQGETDAFEALVRDHGPPLLRYLTHRLRDRTRAEDCLQETFVRVLEHLARYRHRGRFRAWIFQIAHRCLLDEVRRNPEGRTLPLDEEVHTGPGHDRPDAHAERREFAERAAAALDRLPAPQREVFLMRQAGLTFREIARLQGCPLNTALGRMHDAVRALRSLLGEAGE